MASLLSWLLFATVMRLIGSQCERAQVISAYGFSIGNYTSQTLQFIGCIQNTTIYCTQTATSMSFGRSNNYAMVALLGPGTWPTSFISDSNLCASSSAPRQLALAPDGISDATTLCNQLGYNTGSVSANAHGCPKVHWDGTANEWTSNWIAVSGSGR
eukprot:541011_1